MGYQSTHTDKWLRQQNWQAVNVSYKVENVGSRVYRWDSEDKSLHKK